MANLGVPRREGGKGEEGHLEKRKGKRGEDENSLLSRRRHWREERRGGKQSYSAASLPPPLLLARLALPRTYRLLNWGRREEVEVVVGRGEGFYEE